MPAKEVCGAWMPRAKTYCAHGAGHRGRHNTQRWIDAMKERKREQYRATEQYASNQLKWAAKRLERLEKAAARAALYTPERKANLAAIRDRRKRYRRAIERDNI